MFARDWARSDVVALTGQPGEAPLVPPGSAATVARRIGERLTAATAGTAHPVDVDGARLLSERAAYTGHRRRGRVSASGSCRLLPTADGWAAVSCARPDDPALLGALVGRELPGDVWPAVTDWLRPHTGAELTERATLLGLAAGPVPAELPALPVEQPRHPPPWATDPPAARSLADRLVVDFSALWAGPLCAHLLGLAGTRVVKVETPDRPDGARHGDPAFYDLLHRGHDGVVLDPRTPDGRRAMADLVAAADVVVEASRPRALARFGLAAAAGPAGGPAQAARRAGGGWVVDTDAGPVAVQEPRARP